MTQTQPSPAAPAVGPRSRSYSWQDPRPGLARLPVTAGIDLMRALEAGELAPPPISATLGFVGFAVVGEGAVTVTLEPGEHHMNPLGTVHGGVIAALLDTAAGCAVHTTLPAGTGYTSLDLQTRFLRPVRAGQGPVRAEGTVLARGSRTATAEARLLDEQDRLLAHATSTCMVFPIAGPDRA